MKGMNKKLLSVLYRENCYGTKYIFTVEDKWGNLQVLCRSNIIKFKSRDTAKFHTLLTKNYPSLSFLNVLVNDEIFKCLAEMLITQRFLILGVLSSKIAPSCKNITHGMAVKKETQNCRNVFNNILRPLILNC